MIKNKEVTDLFIQTFEGSEPFTPSQKRMMGIQLAQLRKNVKKYIEENKIEIDLPVNEILLNTIKYSQMVGKKFRSISSLGYDVLGDSIVYWSKREEIEEAKQFERENNQVEESYTSIQQESVEQLEIKSYNRNKKRAPKWLDTNEW